MCLLLQEKKDCNCHFTKWAKCKEEEHHSYLCTKGSKAQVCILNFLIKDSKTTLPVVRLKPIDNFTVEGFPGLRQKDVPTYDENTYLVV